MRYVVRTVSWDDTRLKNVDALKERIPDLEVVIDENRDSYATFLEACRLINDTGAILLEDDVLLCKNFTQRVAEVIADKGYDKVYNFFEKPKTLFKTSYVGGSNFLWMQCIYLPPKLPMLIVNNYEDFKRHKPKKWRGMATDCLIQDTLIKNKIKYWRIRPTLVQHLPFKSVIGNRPKNRQSPYFIDDISEEKYDLLFTK